ncbi:MAG: GreA/GreB family elongation factor [Candidatus Uhrbacteria bacterium]|nr:GreA/GreB family elongation factor [Candidatus Uhrbacteria bacterium]
MQLPFRPKQQMKQALQEDEPLYLTRDAIEKMKRRLEIIQDEELPQAIADVRRTGEFGDFSENAEYQEAKGRMRRLHDQATTIKEKLKVVIEIKAPAPGGVVQMGSTVILELADGVQKTFYIVGPQEADPVRGKLSFKSPLGAKLMGRSVREEIELTTPTGSTMYRIHEVR